VNDLRILTWNLWSHDAVIWKWRNRQPRIVQTIRAIAPALAGFQEATASGIAALTAELPHYGWFGVGRDDGMEAGEFNPIFFDQSAVALLRHGTFWLSAACDEPGLGWDARCNRIVTWGEFQRANGDGSFFHFNTHFDHLGREARRESAHLLLEKVREITGGAAAIVTGDFNVGPGSVTYAIIAGKDGLCDARVISTTPPDGPAPTWRGLYLTGLGAQRLDYIFVTPQFAVKKYQARTSPGNCRVASDHLPVIADVAPVPSQ
jgi:endonuclease/exonuclease/phosphatase family metal-dependent hydrolase